MKVSALERILVTERVPRRASTKGDFARPVLHERASSIDEAPFLVTNNRKDFVPTRLRPDRTVWAGFSDAALGQEDPLVQALFQALWRLSADQAWPNRCRSLADAMSLMTSRGLTPHSLVAPVPLLKEASGQDFSAADADKLMFGQGFVAKAGGVNILAADLPPTRAMLFAPPPQVGAYVRSDQALAVLLFRVDRAVVLVDTEARNGVA